MANVDEPALQFFDRLSGRLQIKLTEPSKAFSEHVMNQVAPPSARISQLSLEMSVYDNEDFRELTEAEWSMAVIRDPIIRMRGESDTIVEHRAPSAAGFTVRDLADAVAATEREGRGNSDWMGGIDVHHVFFEGIEDDDGVWSISWGS